MSEENEQSSSVSRRRRKSVIRRRQMTRRFALHPKIQPDRRGSLEAGRRTHPRFALSGTAAYVQVNFSVQDFIGGWILNISRRGIRIQFPQLGKERLVEILSAYAPLIHVTIGGKSFAFRGNPLHRNWHEGDGFAEISFEFLEGEIPEFLIQ